MQTSLPLELVLFAAETGRYTFSARREAEKEANSGDMHRSAGPTVGEPIALGSWTDAKKLPNEPHNNNFYSFFILYIIFLEKKKQYFCLLGEIQLTTYYAGHQYVNRFQPQDV